MHSVAKIKELKHVEERGTWQYAKTSFRAFPQTSASNWAWLMVPRDAGVDFDQKLWVIWFIIHHDSQVTAMCAVQKESDQFSCH